MQVLSSLKLNKLMALLFFGVVGTALAIGGISIFLVGSIHSDYEKMKEVNQESQIFFRVSSFMQNLVWNLFSFIDTGDPSAQRRFITQMNDTRGLIDSYLVIHIRRGDPRLNEIPHLNSILTTLEKVDRISDIVFTVPSLEPGYISEQRIELSKLLQEVQQAGFAIDSIHQELTASIERTTGWKMEIISALYIVLGLLGMAAIFIFYRLSTEKLVRPIQGLAKASLEIAQGKFSTQVETEAVAELGQLQRAFNLMSAKLEEYRQRVESFSENLEKEVEKRTLDLEEANRQLQESQYQISQAERLAVLGAIAAEIAHEINNPLDGIKDCAELLADTEEGLSLEERVKYLQLIKGGLKRIEQVMRQLLDFSREPERTSKRWVNLNELLQEALVLTQHRIARFSVEVVRDLPADLQPVWGDGPALQQVFVNLLLNAVDAMEEVGGTLTVSTRQLEDGMVEVQVMDSGKGIPEEHIDKIFTPFFTTKWPKKGTGLGLPISKRIIKNHQGMITVESQVGKGTCFTIRLPSGSGAAEGEQ